jgi:hypothetical protein
MLQSQYSMAVLGKAISSCIFIPKLIFLINVVLPLNKFLHRLRNPVFIICMYFSPDSVPKGIQLAYENANTRARYNTFSTSETIKIYLI